MTTLRDFLSGRIAGNTEGEEQQAKPAGRTSTLLRPDISGDDDDDGDEFGDDDDDDDEFGDDDDDDDDAFGDDDDIDDLLGEEDDDDEDIGGDEEDSEFVTVGARRNNRASKIKRKIKRLRRRLAAKRKVYRRVKSRRPPGFRNRLKKLSKVIRSLKSKIGRLKRALGSNKKKPRGGKSGGNVLSGTTVQLDPGGGTPALVPFVPIAAPAGDWSGSVSTPILVATIPAGLQTADLDCQTRQLSYLVWVLINLRVSFKSASALFAPLGKDLKTDGAQSFFPDDSNYTDMTPWNVETDTPLPSLRGQPVAVESPNKAILTLAARGANADTGMISVSAMGQIIKDQSAPTKGNFVARPSYPGKYGNR
jgi:hypothetical protein